MRERYIKLFFDHVDHFVSPSRFLADRYVGWGIRPERISVIENIIAPRIARAGAGAGGIGRGRDGAAAGRIFSARFPNSRGSAW